LDCAIAAARVNWSQYSQHSIRNEAARKDDLITVKTSPESTVFEIPLKIH